MEMRVITVDLGKRIFHIVGLNSRGEIVIRKILAPATGPLHTTRQVRLIAMEACGGSHSLGRVIRDGGTRGD